MIEWRVVPSFPWLEASSDGRVRRCLDSFDRRRCIGREIVGAKNAKGYIMVSICYGTIKYKNYGKHVLVCEAFRGRKPTPAHEALHGDGIPWHNAASNLRWGTRRENAADRRKHGRDTVGMRHHSARITDSDVIEIRFLKEAGFTGFGLGLMYGLDRNHVNKIASRKAWPHVAETGHLLVQATLSFGS